MAKTKTNKILEVEKLSAVHDMVDGKTIVLGTGCFDILHVGHLYFLEEAARQGDIFIVGINSDRAIKTMKGSSRPVIPEDQRAKLISVFECVDYVFVYDDIDARNYIPKLRPNVFAIGEGSVEGYPEECNAAKRAGAELFIIKRMPFPSTSSIVAKIQQSERS